jgi:hypothetical protein
VLGGAIATLLLTSLYALRWEPPSRLARLVPQVSAAQTIVEPESELETALPEPIRSVTIEPLAAELAHSFASPIRAAVELPQNILAQHRPKPVMESRLDSESVTGVSGSQAPKPPSVVAAKLETAVIWKPFHSEVSANGFARRLSTQLGYPFKALRAGPARYHVVVEYETEQQRELLQQQVAAITGFNAI